MTHSVRRRFLARVGFLHSNPAAVTAPVFVQGIPFFLAADKVQVKYEMLRAHLLDGVSVVSAACTHGYSRAAFYLVAAAFDEEGMLGLLDDRRGRKGPLRVTREIVAFVRSAPPDRSGADLVAEIQQRFGVHLHRRTIERARHP